MATTNTQAYMLETFIDKALALKLKNQAGKKMATYNLNGFVWALKIWILETYPNCIQWWTKQPDIIPRALAWSNFRKFDKQHLYHCSLGLDSIPILELTPIDKELKETWLIGSLSLSKDESFDASLKPNYSNRDQLNFYYQESQQGSLQHLVKAMEQVMSPDVSCLKSDKLDEQRFDDALQDNAEANLDETLKDNAEMVDTMDNEDGKFCLDDMSLVLKKIILNGGSRKLYIKMIYPMWMKQLDVAVKELPRCYR
ncbi:hypothetical protein Tco_0143533 [Tanacetum coccineum]